MGPRHPLLLVGTALGLAAVAGGAAAASVAVGASGETFVVAEAAQLVRETRHAQAAGDEAQAAGLVRETRVSQADHRVHEVVGGPAADVVPGAGAPKSAGALAETSNDSGSCVAQCGRERAKCREAAQVDGFTWKACGAACVEAQRACDAGCAGKSGEELRSCQAACKEPVRVCKHACTFKHEAWSKCHTDNWRSCRRLCETNALESTLECKNSCSQRGELCSQSAGVGVFTQSACRADCQSARQRCRSSCSGDQCSQKCARDSKVCSNVCEMKRTAARTCGLKASSCRSMSCFPKAAQALKCKAERLSCCLDAGASDCDLSVCWTACKSSKFECLVSCEGKTGSDGKACRNACADTSRQCRGSCHVQRAAKQVCWATWSSCAASAVPLSMAASSSLPDHGEGHQDAEELDALEAEEDEREDEEWLSIEREVFNGYEEESVADDTEDLEAQRLHESDSLQADADADQDRREHAARQSLDVAKLELKAVPSNLQVKTVVGCPSGNGMQTVGDEWIKAVPEQCDKAASDANITASVRCCHDTALPVPARKYGSCTDLGTKTFAEAQAICRAAGMHVCSLEELWADQACKTGCGFDRVRVWTSTECSQTGVRRQSVQSV